MDTIFTTLDADIDAALGALAKELGKLRTGRANTRILDGVRVSYYGQPTPLSQCASLQVKDARTILCKPWDRNLLAEIEKAIMIADLGIMPQNDGEIIWLLIPALNEDRRRDLARQAKNKGEESKISLRLYRRQANDALNKLESEKAISQDEQKRGLNKIQDVTNRGIAKVEEQIAAKEKEIMEV